MPSREQVDASRNLAHMLDQQTDREVRGLARDAIPAMADMLEMAAALLNRCAVFDNTDITEWLAEWNGDNGDGDE